MRTPDEVREHIVRSWIESARDDLAWADMGADAENLRGIAQIGFHAQQAVEKLLKAVLASFDVIPEEHHDLTRPARTGSAAGPEDRGCIAWRGETHPVRGAVSLSAASWTGARIEKD
jgi:hypothetical protein